MVFGIAGIDRQALMNNVVLLAKAAKTFNVPTILTAVETESFSGYFLPHLLNVFPGQHVFERSSMNTWDNQAVVDAIRKTGRKKLVFSALWTEVCLAFPVLEALNEGYEAYIVTDASAGTSQQVHDTAIQRLIQAGAVPITAMQFLLEMQRDWSRRDTYDAVIEIIKQHGGTYGVGIEYAYTMVHKQPQSAEEPQLIT
jgi:nicotinamidase-related amidase